ncbi:MAG: DUF1538 domain-containing protein [Candidatus Desulforudis sp.]|nr:DUF1538 domain-containing protein [Desulforudis sp.]
MEIIIFDGFGHVLREVFTALGPLIAVFLFFQLGFLKLPRERVIQILSGMLLTLVGLAFFLQGVYVGFFPVGSVLGEALGALAHAWILIPVGFALGFVAAVAEPAVRVLNYEVARVSAGYIKEKVMLYALSLGVAASVALAMVRIIYGIPLWYILVPGYLLAVALIRFSPRNFVSIAFDAGGVATGPMTVTFVMALVVGVATAVEGRDPLIEGFGMISMVALAPILSVMLLGLIYRERGREDVDR